MNEVHCWSIAFPSISPFFPGKNLMESKIHYSKAERKSSSTGQLGLLYTMYKDLRKRRKKTFEGGDLTTKEEKIFLSILVCQGLRTFPSPFWPFLLLLLPIFLVLPLIYYRYLLAFPFIEYACEKWLLDDATRWTSFLSILESFCVVKLTTKFNFHKTHN